MQHPSAKNPEAERNDRHLKFLVKKQGACYYAQVEKNRRKSRSEEMPCGVKNPHRKSSKRYEKHVGKNKPVEVDREIESLLIEPVGEKLHEPRGKNYSQHYHKNENDEKHCKRGTQGVFRLPPVPRFKILGEYGYEDRRQRSLGEKAAQQVGDTECDVEGIGLIARSEKRRHHNIPQVSDDSA